MSDLNLFLDVTNKTLVRGQYNAEPFVMPKQFFESTVNVSLMLLRANPDGGLRTPYTVVDPTGMSMTVAVGSFSGTTGTKLASQNSWTIANSKFTGTLNLNTAQMVTAMTGNDSISKTFEIEFGSGNDTYQTPITISGEVITAGSPDPNDYTNTEFADAMEARLADSNSIDIQRASDTITAHVKRKTDGRVLEHSTGIYIDDELTEIVTATLEDGDAKTLTVDAKYRVIEAVYTMNAAGANGSATLSLDTTDREAGDLLFLHFDASSISKNVAVTVNSTAQLTFTTDATNPLSLNARFFYNGTVWALVNAAWSDGTLAAGNFTPTYPDPSSGANETAAQTVSISAAGDTNLTFTEGKAAHAVFADATAGGGGTYTHNLILQRPTTTDEGAPAIDIRVSLAASDNPTVILYDEGPTDSAGDDLALVTFTGNSMRAKVEFVRCIWDAANSQWLIFDSSVGDADGLQTIYRPARSMEPRTTNGAAVGSAETTTNKVMVSTLDFDASTAEYAQFDVTMPKSWDAGTLYYRVHWLTTGSSGNCYWNLQAFSLNDNEAIDAAWGTSVPRVDTALNADRVHISPWSSALTVAGASDDALTVFQVWRDAATGDDTLAADAKLLGVEILYNTSAGNDD